MRRLMREHRLTEPHLEDLGDFFAVTFYGPGERIVDLIPEEGVTDRSAEPFGFAQDRLSRALVCVRPVVGRGTQDLP
jgi:hypothetical protein